MTRIDAKESDMRVVDLERWYSPLEAADKMGVTRQAVHYQIARGALPYVLFKGNRYLRPREVNSRARRKNQKTRP